MGGEGHILDMINRMKNNAASKKAHKEQREKLMDAYRTGGHSIEQNQIRDLDISKENLEKIKEKIRIKLTHEQTSRMIYSIVLTFILSLVIFYLLFFY
ncbi:MAG: hypothetical protein WC384_01570 [Prolixibacteraceae bacterium]|jgi:exosome complex RNA-binding protein Rrp42 (RNase PH superfamily)